MFTTGTSNCALVTYGVTSTVLLALLLQGHLVQADEYCYNSYTGNTRYCEGVTAYCCGLYDGTCCYSSWASIWWFWFIIILTLVALSACCGWYRRRRYLQVSRGAVLVTGPGGPHAGPYQYPAPAGTAGASITTVTTSTGLMPAAHPPPPGYLTPHHPPPPPGYNYPPATPAASGQSYQQQGKTEWGAGNMSAAAPPPPYSSIGQQ